MRHTLGFESSLMPGGHGVMGENMSAHGLHHRVALIFLAVFLYAILATMLAASPANAQVLVASPDHPRTFWTSGYEMVDHYTKWNAADSTLEAHVTYGTPSYAGSWWNPVYYDSFKVKFPQVRLDAKESRLYVLDAHKHQVTVGHLQPGVFGNRVELERHVDLDTHRHNGHLDAALVATSD